MPVLLPGGNIAASTRKEPMSEAAESLVLYSRDSENSENKTPGFWRHFIIFYLKQLISRCCNFHVSVFSFWLRCKPRPDLLIGNKTLFFRVSRLVLFYGVYGRGFDRDLVKNISSCRATLSSSGKWLHREIRSATQLALLFEVKHLAVDITSHLRQIRQIRPSSDAVRRLEVDTDVSRALKVGEIMLGGHRGHCGHTVDYAFRSRSQGYPGLSDEMGQ